MNPLLNIHCHPQKEQNFRSDTIYSYIYPNLPGLGPKHCSSGIHPWYIPAKKDLDWDLFLSVAKQPQVKLIGECGLDTFSKIDLDTQIKVFRKQIEIAELVQKPLLIHMVRTTTEIMALKQEYQPKQTWIIHGFRGKPELAQQYYEHGILLSTGPQFNPQTIQTIPLEKLLVETSDTGLPIDDVLKKIALIKNTTIQALKKQIYTNTASLFFG